MASKKFFFRHGTFSINDGAQIHFWEDNWLDYVPLCEQYPALYSIVRRKSDIISTLMATSPPDVTFRRDLIGPRLVAWNSLLIRLEDVQLSPGPDEFRWNLHANGNFSVDSLYKAIPQSDILVDNNKNWMISLS
jgi:hypothetical protein